MADVKICGLTAPDGVAAALEGRARWIGFVFFPKSPRHVAPEEAAALAAPARGRADTVAVTVNADDTLLETIAATLAPDWIQLHGSEPPARSAQVRRFAKKGVIRAVSVATAEDFRSVDAHAGAADWLLFDAKAPAGAALPGGNGAAFDWRILSGRMVPKPWMLSGGLAPENVRAAIEEAQAAAVDVSSGVERAPGLKDPERIARFLASARTA